MTYASYDDLVTRFGETEAYPAYGSRRAPRARPGQGRH